jgi:hypothetical protein
VSWAAEHHVVFVDPAGARRRGRIAIGGPEPTEDRWTCRVLADGIVEGEITERSAVRVLVRALEHLASTLHERTQEGWRYLEPSDDSDAELALLFCGFWR